MDFRLLRKSDLRQLSNTLVDLYEPVSSDKFVRHVLSLINRLVPEAFCSCDLIEFQTGNVESQVSFGEPITDTPLGATLTEGIRLYIHQNPLAGYLEDGGEGNILKLSDFMSQRRLKQTDLYHEVLKRVGVRHQVAMVLRNLPSRFGGFTINIPGAKDFSQEFTEVLELLASHITRAHANSLLFSAHLQAPVHQGCYQPKTLAKLGITRREAEVLRWVQEGKRDAEIAIILGLSRRTVEVHVGRLLKKLGVETRTAAAAAAGSLER